MPSLYRAVTRTDQPRVAAELRSDDPILVASWRRYWVHTCGMRIEEPYAGLAQEARRSAGRVSVSSHLRGLR